MTALALAEGTITPGIRATVELGGAGQVIE
jgi:hypothetical protein